MYENLKYKRGYIISDEELKVPYYFKEAKVNKYNIYYDPDNKFSVKYYEDKFVVLLGNVIDVEKKNIDMDIIAYDLVKVLNESEIDFLSYLDNLAGRHIIFWGDENGSKICSDATGMKIVAYHTNRTLISSHVMLIQEIAKEEENKQFEKIIKVTSRYNLPGNITKYENIKILTPNTLFSLNNKTIKRFWPREDIKMLNLEDIVNSIIKDSKTQLELISKEKNLLLSLTGGMDTRTTLAMAREYVDDIELFTYSFKNASKLVYILDYEVAKDIAQKLKLNHKPFCINKGENYSQFKEILKSNSFLKQHSHALAKSYYDLYSQRKDLIYIRSNLYEIIRVDYREVRSSTDSFNLDGIVKCLFMSKDKYVYEFCENYMNEIQMNNIFNYDGYDLLYWEQSMGTWFSDLIIESDLSFDSMELINCRRMLEKFLSVSLEDRKSGKIQKEIINKQWPELNDWGINDSSFINHRK